MKFSIDIECTPAEARAFLGLPDVEGFQRDIVELIRSRTAEHLKTMGPEALMKTWMPMGIEAMNALQQAFTSSLGGAAASRGKSERD
jgi:hypothetical protein